MPRDRDPERAASASAQTSGTVRITPKDIQEKVFRNAFRGYHEREVDEFLDQVTEEMARLYAENKRLHEEVSRQAAAPPQPPPAPPQPAPAPAAVTGAAADAARMSALASGFITREREFLQTLAGLIQSHAEAVKQDVRRAREREPQPVRSGSAGGPPGPPAAQPPGEPAPPATPPSPPTSPAAPAPRDETPVPRSPFEPPREPGGVERAEAPGQEPVVAAPWAPTPVGEAARPPARAEDAPYAAAAPSFDDGAVRSAGAPAGAPFEPDDRSTSPEPVDVGSGRPQDESASPGPTADPSVLDEGEATQMMEPLTAEPEPGVDGPGGDQAPPEDASLRELFWGEE